MATSFTDVFSLVSCVPVPESCLHFCRLRDFLHHAKMHSATHLLATKP